MVEPRAILSSRFHRAATLDWQYSKSPALTLRDAFAGIGQSLPVTATVVFDRWNGRTIADVYPFCPPDAVAWENLEEPTHLSFRHYEANKVVQISRIHVAGNEARKCGAGTAMIASQLPFWQSLGIETITVKAHEMSAGFYVRLGFTEIDHLPEEPFTDYAVLTLMQLDLRNPQQTARLKSAIDRAGPLQARKLSL